MPADAVLDAVGFANFVSQNMIPTDPSKFKVALPRHSGVKL